jgi:hypothetical protein
MNLQLGWLLGLAMCVGPVDEKCQDEYFENVHSYTEEQCNLIFKDEAKCEKLANNRVKELKQNCSE